jgi:glycerophosphoryl diester phosphodiesterase
MAERPLVIAHRGDSANAPEQTHAAYELAIERGADMIEADVRRTRDNRLVMLHDATLHRTTSGSGRVADIDFAELRALDAGAWYSPEFAGQVVPTLEELFDLAERRGVALCLEVKAEDSRTAATLALDVAEAIARRRRVDRDVLSSFDQPSLAVALRAHPGLSLAPDRLPERGPSTVEALVAQARAIGATIIQHHHADLDASIVAGCHTAGLAVWPWPTTDARDIERVHRMGVDAFMGDDVAAMVRERDAAHA